MSAKKSTKKAETKATNQNRKVTKKQSVTVEEAAPAAGKPVEPKPVEPKAPKAPKTPKEDLMTFAFRLPKSESAEIHKAAGSGKASQFARSVLLAAARKDEAAIAEILKGIAS